MTTSVSRRKVAEAVRMERARQQLSQAEVARRARVNERRVVQIENESGGNLLFSTVDRITDALGLRITVEPAA